MFQIEGDVLFLDAFVYGFFVVDVTGFNTAGFVDFQVIFIFTETVEQFVVFEVNRGRDNVV